MSIKISQYEARTVSDLPSLIPSYEGAIVDLLGYYVVGDGGAQLLRYHKSGRSGVVIDNGFYFAGGLADDYFESVDQSRVNVARFGAIPDSGLSESQMLARLQQAVDSSISHKCKCVIPTGEYLIDGILWVTGSDSATPTTFISAQLEGVSSPGYGAASSINLRTRIISSSLTLPVLGINMAREVLLSNLMIVGPNAEPVNADATNWDKADWLTAGVSNSRYAPQCGIAIDLNVASNPGSGYAGLTYAGSAAGSNYVKMRDLYISNHAVGVCIRPDGGSNQNDQIQLDNVQIYQCVTGFAGGATQMRPTSSLLACTIANCHTGIDMNTYGGQIGLCPSSFGLQLQGVYRIFNVHSNYGTIVVDSLYAENFNEIGRFGTGIAGSKGAAIFTGCYFSRQTSLDNTNTAGFFIAANLPIKFISCRFHVNDEVFNIISGRGYISFDTCFFRNVGGGSFKYIGAHRDDTNGMRFSNCTKNGSGVTLAMDPFAINGGVLRETQVGSKRYEPTRTPGLIHTGRSNFPEFVVYGSLQSMIRDTTASAINLAGTILTFSTTDTPFWQVGDLVFGSVVDPLGEQPSSYPIPAFKVTNVSSAVTATGLFAAEWLTAPTTIRTPVLEWCPMVDLTGDTNGTTIISNVSYDGIIQAGDWIKGSADIPTNTRVVSVDEGANTITLSRAATGSTVGVKLFFARLHSTASNPVF